MRKVKIKWSGEVAEPSKTPYKRLDFFDGDSPSIGTRYYCTFGNGCTYCRSAPHAKSKNECEYLQVEGSKC